MLSLATAIFLIVGFELGSWMSANAYSCSQQLNACSCVTDVGGWLLDLSPLDQLAQGLPPLSVNDSSSDIYYL